MRTEQGSNIGEGASLRAQDLGQQPYQNRGLGWSSRNIFGMISQPLADMFSSEGRARRAFSRNLTQAATQGIVQGAVDNAVAGAKQRQTLGIFDEHIKKYRKIDPETGLPREGALDEEEQKGVPDFYIQGLGSINVRHTTTETIGKSDVAHRKVDELSKRLKDLQEEHKTAQSTITDLQDQIKKGQAGGGQPPAGGGQTLTADDVVLINKGRKNPKAAEMKSLTGKKGTCDNCGVNAKNPGDISSTNVNGSTVRYCQDCKTEARSAGHSSLKAHALATFDIPNPSA